jgi:uncharacterized protein YodC (DUF2158 family)
MALFKKDDVVKLKMVVPSGAVQKMAMDDDGKVSCLLEWVNENGETQQRWFAEELLEAA